MLSLAYRIQRNPAVFNSRKYLPLAIARKSFLEELQAHAGWGKGGEMLRAVAAVLHTPAARFAGEYWTTQFFEGQF